MDCVTVMSDSLVLVEAIRKRDLVDSSILSILWDICSLLNSFLKINFVHVNRQFNRLAHELAHVGLNYSP